MAEVHESMIEIPLVHEELLKGAEDRESTILRIPSRLVLLEWEYEGIQQGLRKFLFDVLKDLSFVLPSVKKLQEATTERKILKCNDRRSRVVFRSPEGAYWAILGKRRMKLKARDRDRERALEREGIKLPTPRVVTPYYWGKPVSRDVDSGAEFHPERSRLQDGIYPKLRDWLDSTHAEIQPFLDLLDPGPASRNPKRSEEIAEMLRAASEGDTPPGGVIIERKEGNHRSPKTVDQIVADCDDLIARLRRAEEGIRLLPQLSASEIQPEPTALSAQIPASGNLNSR